jgi:PKD repeat protein
MRKKFFQLGVVLVLAITIAVSLARTQTTQTPQMAYASGYEYPTCCLYGAACDAFCPYYSISWFIVTPYGQTAGPNDTQPTWSADGTKIAFTRNGDIFVADNNGGNAANVTNTGNNQDPAWSPDGARIAFTTTRDGHFEVYLMNPDGSNVVRLTNNIGVSVGRPAWSHDGAHIAFNCQVVSGNDDICAINSDGTGFVRLTADPAADGSPAWSPDGASIAFATGRYGSNLQLAVMNPDGTGVTQLGAGIIGWDPAWSPDGAQIAFGVPDYDEYGNYTPDIYLMQADGTNVAPFSYIAESPAWKPMQVPIATFRFSCTGTTCNFDASGSKDSYGTITSYSWSFGDRATATGPIVSHTYASGAAYTTRLTVTDSNGATGTKFQTIAINPVATFTFSCSGLSCNFDASGSRDSSGTITSYTWNFGDGATGAGVTISHTYAVGNSYTVTLTVTDSVGAIGTQTTIVNVNTPPVASFTFACSGLTCSFNGSGSRDYDGTITSYAWNFGDGTAASGPTVTHTYAAGGQYTVTLTVTDNAGATNAQNQTVVANSPPVASFTFSCSRFTCSFDASGSYDRDGNITTWTWNFGDGTTLTGSYEWVGHTYPAPGTYTVTLTVTDNGGATGRQSNSVTVVRPK